MIRRTAALLAVCLACLAVARAYGAPPADVEGWRQARWGMDRAALEDAFGEALTALPGPWDFGPLYADRALFEARFAGLEFTAFLQMDRRDDALAQVLLERRDAAVTDAAYAELLDGLDAAFGPPDAVCRAYPEGRGPTILQARWDFPTTTVHASLLDFVTTGIAFYGTEGFPGPFETARDSRIIEPRALPRRILLRLHPAGRTDLLPRRGCPIRSPAD
ncbi:MAG: hypothetical protein GVY13_16525 [Alphaproteobacteria bacterium]|jgi:hypothetical protein|nr:hypothetical protein [Alphaproteobacteria bacterium]